MQNIAAPYNLPLLPPPPTSTAVHEGSEGIHPLPVGKVHGKGLDLPDLILDILSGALEAVALKDWGSGVGVWDLGFRGLRLLIHGLRLGAMLSDALGR